MSIVNEDRDSGDREIAAGWPEHLRRIVPTTSSRSFRDTEDGNWWRFEPFTILPDTPDNLDVYRDCRVAADRTLRGVLRLDVEGTHHPDFLYEILGLEPPAEGPAITWHVFPGGPPLIVHVRRMRAYLRHSPVVAEILWEQPPNVFREALRNTTGRHFDREIKPAQAALEEIVRYVRRGSVPRTRAEKLALLQRAALRLHGSGDPFTRWGLANDHELMTTEGYVKQLLREAGTGIRELSKWAEINYPLLPDSERVRGVR
jgi:hypothetical protein